ncbi:MAG: carboxyl transferase domain-containing protein [Bryobacterales bacterium]
MKTYGASAGNRAVYGGIIKHGAKLFHAFHAEATVPKAVVITQGLRRGLLRNGVQARPHGRQLRVAERGDIAVMGPEQAVNIVYAAR